VCNGVVILSGNKGSGRNHVTNYLRNRGVISRVKKGKIAQSYCTDLGVSYEMSLSGSISRDSVGSSKLEPALVSLESPKKCSSVSSNLEITLLVLLNFKKIELRERH
jgi:hypothetical protein